LIDAVLDAGQMDVILDFAAPLPAIVTAEMLAVPISDQHDPIVFRACSAVSRACSTILHS